MSDAKRFENMGAIVTGGASGIGLAVARRIVAEGGQVTLWDVEQASSTRRRPNLASQSRGARVDVTDPGEVERAAKEAERRWGMSTCWCAAPGSRARTPW